jgi:hypothetical protein
VLAPTSRTLQGFDLYLTNAHSYSALLLSALHCTALHCTALLHTVTALHYSAPKYTLTVLCFAVHQVYSSLLEMSKYLDGPSLIVQLLIGGDRPKAHR